MEATRTPAICLMSSRIERHRFKRLVVSWIGHVSKLPQLADCYQFQLFNPKSTCKQQAKNPPLRKIPMTTTTGASLSPKANAEQPLIVFELLGTTQHLRRTDRVLICSPSASFFQQFWVESEPRLITSHADRLGHTEP